MALTVAEPLIQASLLGEALDNGPVAVFVADEHMRYIAVNEYACKLLGYEREELLALKVTDVAGTTEDAPAAFQQLLLTGNLDGVTTIKRKDGVELPFTYRARETAIAGMTLYVSVGWTP